MGFQVGVKDILLSGGVTLALLIGLSVYSIGLIWERIRFHRSAMNGQDDFLAAVRQALSSGDLPKAVGAARAYPGLAASIVMASLVGSTHREERIRSAQRATERALSELERRTAALGTIASTAPFIGLFGTVVGVMRAFKDLAGAAGAGPGVVAIGISEALVCTAAGLFVAVPAVVAYNLFSQRASRFADEMGWISDEILDALSESPRGTEKA